jgi:hypothetical protein
MNTYRGFIGPVLIAIVSTVQPQFVLGAQVRGLTVEEVRMVFASGGDVRGWDEFDIPEFVAAAYGSRAKAALISLLNEPSTAENYFVQLLALTTAQYGRVDIPDHVVLDFATGRKGAAVGGVLRHRALMALRMRPNPDLREFWVELSGDRDPSYRQAAAGGLACALGMDAAPQLNALSADPNPAVARVADFYIAELTTKGPAALACGGKTTRTEAATFPWALRPELRAKGAMFLQRVP